MMKSIDMKITEEIAVLSVSGSGYTKEINLVIRQKYVLLYEQIINLKLRKASGRAGGQ